ncbi:MAG: CoA pyrophosphatase [Spirochaetes bacterium]|nr:CoA pyrophosphatase [Spirochaetota bacterium]
MKMRFKTDADFAAFKDELRSRLASRQNRDLEKTGLKHSAVMVLLMNKEGAAHVLLTRRTDTVSTHKGQVAFPGGGMDDHDDDYRAIAYRETYEEVGIPPEKIEYLGRFDDYVSITGFHVTCFIGAIGYPYECMPNRDEIESHFEAPLEMFVEQRFERTEIYNFGGKDYRVFYYYHASYEIWGLTARILTDFGEKICRD